MLIILGIVAEAKIVRVFISSVRRGLEEERDSLPGLIMALGHEPVRFENFTAQPVPSREACLKGVESADLYLLLLGPHYGQPLPETGKSPTHEEFVVARRKGIPRIVMRNDGVVLDADQAMFVGEVEAYSTGLFRSGFTNAVDLQQKVAAALRQVASMPSALEWRPLAGGAVTLDWREQWTLPRRQQQEATCVEVHVLPIDAQRLSARQLRDASDRLASQLRSVSAVNRTAGLTTGSDQTAAWVLVEPSTPRRTSEVPPGRLLGVRLSADFQASVWEQLPTDGWTHP